MFKYLSLIDKENFSDFILEITYHRLFSNLLLSTLKNFYLINLTLFFF